MDEAWILFDILGGDVADAVLRHGLGGGDGGARGRLPRGSGRENKPGRGTRYVPGAALGL